MLNVGLSSNSISLCLVMLISKSSVESLLEILHLTAETKKKEKKIGAQKKIQKYRGEGDARCSSRIGPIQHRQQLRPRSTVSPLPPNWPEATTAQSDFVFSSTKYKFMHDSKCRNTNTNQQWCLQRSQTSHIILQPDMCILI